MQVDKINVIYKCFYYLQAVVVLRLSSVCSTCVIKFPKTSHTVVFQRESRFRVSKRLAPFNVAVEHLSVFQDERTELIYVPKNTGKLAEYRTCKAANPGKKGPEIIECLTTKCGCVFETFHL